MEKVQIIARFLLDDNGMPRFVEQDNRKHYRIELRVEGASPDTYAVNYQLHETYYDPIREVHDSQTQFAETFTSYGDFTVQAQLRNKTRVEVLTTMLSDALKRGHDDPPSPSVAMALKNIRGN